MQAERFSQESVESEVNKSFLTRQDISSPLAIVYDLPYITSNFSLVSTALLLTIYSVYQHPKEEQGIHDILVFPMHCRLLFFKCHSLDVTIEMV